MRPAWFAPTLRAMLLRPWFAALGFLTRVRTPDVALSETDLARAAGYFAWVGALLAGFLWGGAQLLPVLGARSTALGMVALWAWLTGGLHLDGLADTVDGFSGGRGERERTLAIMRDSRIGAHGALALALLLLVKWSVLEDLVQTGSVAFVVAPIGARFACTLLLWRFPYARESGLGSAFAGRVGLREVAIGAFPVGGALIFGGARAATGVALSALVALALGTAASRRLGGLTGDVYGAAIELSEAVCLVALSLRLPKSGL